MNKYSERLHTFSLYKKDPSFIKKLCDTGFYYNRNAETTICVHCNIEIRNWLGTENPEEVHKKMSPMCPSFLEKQYSSKENRLKSFEYFPSQNLNLKKFADSGFFYTGFKDIVECFKCKINLGDWSETDDPFISHQELNKNCEFIKSQQERTANFMCEICMINQKSVCLLPCAHVVSCLKCSDSITTHCPLCRTPVSYKLKLYI